MLRNAQAREYLKQRRAELQAEVNEQIVYDVEDAVRELRHVYKLALDKGDLTSALRACVEALKVQGKYITHSENVSHQVTLEDRMRAKELGLGLNEYVRRKQEGTLPPLPEGVTKR